MPRRSRHPVALLTCVLIMLGAVLWTSAATAMTAGTAPATCLTMSSDETQGEVRRSGHAEMAKDCHTHEVGGAMACAALFDLRAILPGTLLIDLHPAALSLPATRHVKGMVLTPDSPPPKIL